MRRFARWFGYVESVSCRLFSLPAASVCSRHLVLSVLRLLRN